MDQITEGIVFRQIKMATGRRMILLFTKKYGKISVGTNISEKGRTRSSLALRPFTYGSYHIFEGRNYFNLDKADSIRSFYSIGEDLDKYVSAGFVLELTEKAVPEGIPQPAVFQLLLDFMEEISERNGQHRTLVLAYEIQLLRILGFFPKLDSCACCGRPGNWKSFSVPDGGTICPECREKKSASGEEFYPCRLVASFSFAYIRATETAAIVRQMKQYKRDTPADVEVFEVPAIVLKAGGDADSGEKAPESPDRQILGSIKALLLFDPLGLEITGALTGLYAAPEDAIRDVIKRLTLSD